MLGKITGRERENKQEVGEYCTETGLITRVPYEILGDQIEEGEIAGRCTTRGRENK